MLGLHCVGIASPAPRSCLEATLRSLSLLCILTSSTAVHPHFINCCASPPSATGRSHGKATTFPRLADPLGFVKAEDIFHAGALAVAGRVDCYFIERGSITGALGWMTGLAVQSRQRET